MEDLLNMENGIIDERIIKAVKEMGFEQFSPIQDQAIPEILAGRDIIGQAQTGTGKTAAFGIPLLQMVEIEKECLQGLILCPTRELAIQAAEELRKFSKYMSGIKVLPIYGGQDMGRQIKSLKGCPQIIVGTPGRVMDHMRRRTIRLNNLKMVVMDEADEMLNMGFREDMETILDQVEGEHQTVLFSATMPKSILNITGQFQKEPTLIKTVQKELTVPLIKQYYYEVRRDSKKEVVARLLDYYNPKLTLIFCNTKRMVEELAEDLKGRGYFADGIHGDLSQNQRDRVMESFRSGATDILIATDVAARGIDVDDVEAVINFDVPQDNEYYVHRIGRTGRAGRKGRAFTLVVGREIYKIREIESTCKTTMKAKVIPTVADIAEAKSQKILNSVFEIMHNKDISKATGIIESKMEEEDCTAIELAAAFLQSMLGEEKEEIEIVSHSDRRRRNDRGGNGNGDSHRRDGRRSDGRDGSRGGYSRGGYGSRRSDGRGEGKSEGRSPYRVEGKRNESKPGDRKYGEKKYEDMKPEDKKKVKLRNDGSVAEEKKKYFPGKSRSK